MKYILITGGVISGVGKGIIASSIGVLLKAKNVRVTAIKIDPYINIDAGTFSPYEHGEVFVLNDGSEVDLDLGNYERFLNVQLHSDNNITTGKIYASVIQEERDGLYLGKTVQVIPHITAAIQKWIKRVAAIPVDGSNLTPEVCIIELGGTIGDIEVMPFIEALSHFSVNELKGRDFINIHVSYLLEPKSVGEQKTKPTQASARELRRLGLSPDLIVCRSDNMIRDGAKTKISNFCHIPLEQVIGIHDVPSVNQVPILLEEQHVWRFINEKLQLNKDDSSVDLSDLQLLLRQMDKIVDSVRIVMVRKYVKIKDAYTSVIEALKHAAFHYNRRLDLQLVDSSHLEPETKTTDPKAYKQAWETLSNADGVLVPGGFGDRGIEGKILACKFCRENRKPMLGICLGMQCAVVEFARNVLLLSDANSSEFDKQTKAPVVIEMPEHHTGKMGGTMRLGLRRSYFKQCKSKIKQLYAENISIDEEGREFIEERHRHRYEVNPTYVPHFEQNGLVFVSTDVEGKRMEICELQGHKFYVGVQYHPEYLSRSLQPSPPYLGLIKAATGEYDKMPVVNGF